KEKRHPTLQDNVIVGAGAKILGPVTIGYNSRIGAGSVVLDEVPPDSTVIGVPARMIYTGDITNNSVMDIDWRHISDPAAKAIKCMLDRIFELEGEIKDLKNEIEVRKKYAGKDIS
ncbi:MAG: serine O-acetyltransferase, partial [Nitrospinota bacterium]